ncbi:MAG TPA: hypothetical protein VKF15_03845 [Nitrososphaerales archaeon]|nr:hypothetical protein [Nitrososphaerales archaeon]
MFSSGRAIQGLVLFSAVLGVAFLWQVNGLLPPFVFDFLATGWVLFLVDGALTFIRPRASYAMAFVLALLALISSLPQSAHYAFIAEGAVLPSVTFVAGTLAQVLLLVLVPFHFLRAKRRSSAGLVQGQ